VGDGSAHRRRPSALAEVTLWRFPLVAATAYLGRSHDIIESLGYEIVANFGDQFSDFTGGFEDRTFKMPNPNYYLP
jgi:putative acid phosphatase of HAD superfamily subfamily IIIB